MINSFRHKYFFLSNFYNAPVSYLGNSYLNNEAAFQAQKTCKPEERIQFSCLNPSEAKRLGRHIKLRPDWEDVKSDCMYEICFAKFTQNKEIGNKLIATGNELLEEGNTWGDKEWGTVDGVGNNKLGKILMRVRSEIAIK